MLQDIQEILARALTSDDPHAALTRLIADSKDLSSEDRERLDSVDADGLRLTALLIEKLRFERLTAGHSELAELFAADPQQFMELYRRYRGETRPYSYFPAEEARQFEEWRRRSVE